MVLNVTETVRLIRDGLLDLLVMASLGTFVLPFSLGVLVLLRIGIRKVDYAMLSLCINACNKEKEKKIGFIH